MTEGLQMDFSEFKELTSSLKAKKPIWFSLETDPLATDSEIEAAETQLRILLPIEYKSFVSEYGGGYFAFAIVYSVANSDWNIVRMNQKFAIPQFVAISDNGCGDLYGYRVVDNSCVSTVSLWIMNANLL